MSTLKTAKIVHLPERTYLTSNEVMAALGYKDRGSFWQLVYDQGIPHVRLNARVIRFPKAGLEDWMRQRSSEAA